MKKIWNGLIFRLGFIIGMIGLFITGMISRDGVNKIFIEVGNNLKKQGEK